MATTPIYALPSPDLGTTADGPAAISALATRVEREMTALRTCTDYNAEPNSWWNDNTIGNVVFSVNAPVSVIGYLEIEAFLNLRSDGNASIDGGSGKSFAGFAYIIVDGAQVRRIRWHALWGTRHMSLTFSGKVANSAAQTSRLIQIVMDFQTGNDVGVNHTALYVCQVGAPGSGLISRLESTERRGSHPPPHGPVECRSSGWGGPTTMARPTFVQIRSTLLLVGGLAGAAYVTIVDQTDRPTLLILFAAMMGLPLFLRNDEKNQVPEAPPPPHPPQVGAGNEQP